MLWGAEGGTGARQANRGREAHRCRRQGGEGNLLCTSNEARLFGEQPLPSLFRWVLATLQAGAEWWWPCRALLAVVLRCKWVGRMVHWHWDCPSLSLRRRTDHNGSPSPLSAAPKKTNCARARPAKPRNGWKDKPLCSWLLSARRFPHNFEVAPAVQTVQAVQAAWACELCRNSGRSRRRTLGGDEENPSWAKEGGVEFSSGFKGNGNRP